MNTLALCVAAAVAACAATHSLADVGGAVPPIHEAPGFSDLAERWKGAMDTFEVPGLAVAIVKDGKLFAAEGFGFRDAAQTKPVDADTMFYIASITKTYVGAAISKLADEGKVSLDDPIRSVLPRFEVPDAEATKSTTLRQLLGHRPGISCGPAVLLDAYTGEITDERYFALLKGGAIANKTAYSNIHFTLLGRVIEAKTGKPWREYLAESIFAPAGMTRTTGYADRMYADDNHADPLEWAPAPGGGGGSWKAAQKKSDQTMHAAGGLGTSARDGAAWVMLHVNGGRAGDKQVLPERAVREAFTLNTRLPEPDGSIRVMEGYGLAWQVGKYHGHLFAHHGGGYTGTAAYMAVLPEDRAGLVILMNAAGASRGLGDVIAIDVLDRLSGTKTEADLLASYTKRAREYREKRKEDPSPPPITAQGLSGKMEAYAGTYFSGLLGKMTVAREADALTISLGECPLRVEPAGTDEFKVTGPAGEAKGKFAASAQGGVETVTLTVEGMTEPVVFTRK